MNVPGIVRTGIFGVVLLFCTVALAQDVAVRYDGAYDFGQLKTFSAKIGTHWGNDINEKRFISEFETALTSKGWTKADEATADALVFLHGAAQRRKAGR